MENTLEKRVILTGSNGLLGQKIIDLLRERTAVELIAVSRGEDRYPEPEGYEYVDADVTDEDEMKRIFEEYEPTEVIHSAAVTNVDLCEDEKELCWVVNVDSVRILCDLCQKYNTRLIFLSTDFIFDGEKGPYKETDRPNPISYYGNSKYAAEELIQSSDVKFAIIRTVLLYGVVRDMSRSNIVLWAKGALEKGQQINVVNDQARTPTLAEDLAQGVVLCLMKDKEGIYHVSGAEQMTIVDLVRKVADFWDLDKGLITEVSSSTLNQRAKRPPVTGFVILKAQADLGYKPHSFTEGLRIVDKQLKDTKST